MSETVFRRTAIEPLRLEVGPVTVREVSPHFDAAPDTASQVISQTRGGTAVSEPQDAEPPDSPSWAGPKPKCGGSYPNAEAILAHLSIVGIACSAASRLVGREDLRRVKNGVL